MTLSPSAMSASPAVSMARPPSSWVPPAAIVVDDADPAARRICTPPLLIVVLIAIAIGWREAVVTLVVIPTTILLTLFAANLMGYTINRVSLFALIFSIGILVDDASVVVENIARHWAMHDGRPRLKATIEAVAEVGEEQRREDDREEDERAAHRRRPDLHLVRVGRVLAHVRAAVLDLAHPLDEERPEQEPEQERREPGGDDAERRVPEDVERAEPARERVEQVVEHR